VEPLVPAVGVAADKAAHWDATYVKRGSVGVSWFQKEPVVSLALIAATELAPSASVIDVGGGASVLVDRLGGLGFRDLTVLDVSEVALAEDRSRLGESATVEWIQQDVLEFEPKRTYDIWHDRAVFHFLVDEHDRRKYRDVLLSASAPGGHLIIGAFAEDGPEKCSGLPVARYSADKISDALGAAFVVTQTRREEHVTPGGILQPFTWVAATRAS
jgi:SAM-dependent methyltransferase